MSSFVEHRHTLGDYTQDVLVKRKKRLKSQDIQEMT